MSDNTISLRNQTYRKPLASTSSESKGPTVGQESQTPTESFQGSFNLDPLPSRQNTEWTSVVPEKPSASEESVGKSSTGEQESWRTLFDRVERSHLEKLGLLTMELSDLGHLSKLESKIAADVAKGQMIPVGWGKEKPEASSADRPPTERLLHKKLIVFDSDSEIKLEPFSSSPNVSSMYFGDQSLQPWDVSWNDPKGASLKHQ
jgi:hypothetical protein